MRIAAFMLCIITAATANAQSLGGPMRHLLISQQGQSLAFEFETQPNQPPTFESNEDLFAGPASVLNGSAYNAQFGWLASGFFDLPAGARVFVDPIRQSNGLRVYDAFSFAPILGTEGSADLWEWSGVMTHNWYAVNKRGAYSATYDVYVGDDQGNPLQGWLGARVDLHWDFPFELSGPSLQISTTTGPVPTPGTLAVAVAASALIRTRSRAR